MSSGAATSDTPAAPAKESPGDDSNTSLKCCNSRNRLNNGASFVELRGGTNNDIARLPLGPSEFCGNYIVRGRLLSKYDVLLNASGHRRYFSWPSGEH